MGSRSTMTDDESCYDGAPSSLRGRPKPVTMGRRPATTDDEARYGRAPSLLQWSPKLVMMGRRLGMVDNDKEATHHRLPITYSRKIICLTVGSINP
ncbi:hypothetical protein BHM03_00046687 [Ensete ventricosum]|nr:hypothetical protein BHM03_00046687 [Ensete ventricosum]